ncbi:aa3-type cytochrome c oxidase subunit IV [Mesorhizobium sp. BR1-1-16]|uniref:aa3-type cytochrome c oxidase subunit IV n=1 Tax=Mesorhizobium sp. BR1-1-16 TaxID=2876653 RepID=UPI001CCA3081|nr:aa3-type cytochrome c oxidase subunit IV [Mesorhizobium sp. BR1-1-16]MBZ9939201.1 aa3-type cytochrome c oxidase subunit IV [Mesorhizobium sp. BR1-1-16]
MTDIDHATDIREHEQTYDLFIRVATMGSLHVAAILLALVIGTIEGQMWIGAIGAVAATAAAGYGMMRPGRGDPVPGTIVVALLVILMGVFA